MTNARLLPWLLPLLLSCDLKREEELAEFPDYSTVREVAAPTHVLWIHNASRYGRTHRWPDGPIPVRLHDPRLDPGRVQVLLDRLNPYLGNCRLVLANEGTPGTGIYVSEDPGRERNTGEARVWLEGWCISGALVKLGEVRYYEDGTGFLHAMLFHEIVHALGFCEHTGDGGLMDATIRNDYVSPTVQALLSELHAAPPGTWAAH